MAGADILKKNFSEGNNACLYSFKDVWSHGWGWVLQGLMAAKAWHMKEFSFWYNFLIFQKSVFYDARHRVIHLWHTYLSFWIYNVSRYTSLLKFNNFINYGCMLSFKKLSYFCFSLYSLKYYMNLYNSIKWLSYIFL